MPNVLLEAVESVDESVISNAKIDQGYAAVSETFEKLENRWQHVIKVQEENIAALKTLRGLDKQSLGAASARITELEGVLNTVYARLVAAPRSTELKGMPDTTRTSLATAPLFPPTSYNPHYNPPSVLAAAGRKRTAPDPGPPSRPTRRRRRNAFRDLDEVEENDTPVMARACQRRTAQRYENYCARCVGEQRDPTPDLEHFISATDDPTVSDADITED